MNDLGTMLQSVSKQFRRYARILWAASSDVTPEKIPAMFLTFAKFLHEEPAENFSYANTSLYHGPEGKVRIPLDMPKGSDAYNHFKEKVGIEFPDRVKSGESNMPSLNFLYMLGQALTVLYYVMIPNTNNPKYAEGVDKLTEFWGGDHAMGAGPQVTKYSGSSNEKVKPLLVEKLVASAHIAQEHILPFIHKDQEPSQAGNEAAKPTAP